MNAARIESASPPWHARYLDVVAQIEQHFRVANWRSEDVDIWPLARMELHADMYWANLNQTRPAAPVSRLPAIARAARPLRNLWRSRHDLGNWVARPRQSYAIFLGDGVSLDRVEGRWQDRFGEPIFAALERRDLRTFIMQSGHLTRLPWKRPTFAANVVEARNPKAALKLADELPDHGSVIRHLARAGVTAPSLEPLRLLQLAHTVSRTATGFERLLACVKPTVAFVVTYYTGLGPPFVLACRRQGILSVDLQHCPQDGAHKAYVWTALPAAGYRTLPALFWNWSAREAAHIQQWADTLTLPWHQSLHGGHTQLTSFLDDQHPTTRFWDARFAAIGRGESYEREILVALQPIGGQRERWKALARQIEASPRTWRWWIRRHPSSGVGYDVEYAQLLGLNLANVVVDDASAIPLPALLRHMNALVSIASGAAAEAAVFGIPSLFLSEEATATFPGLLSEGSARVIEPGEVNAAIAPFSAGKPREVRPKVPDLDETLLRLEQIAARYANLHRTMAAT